VLESRLLEANRANRPISCIMLDVDHFKRFNDKFGHDAGDAVLRAIGEILKRSVRESDAFRYGGEEFLLLMPDMEVDQALLRAEEVRRKIETLQIEHAGRDLGTITASLGTATAPNHCAFSKLVRTADAALLRAKESGRNVAVQTELRRVEAEGPSSTSKESAPEAIPQHPLTS
jgi:diguanylate cyclase (GGDEF)-like protein